MKMHYAGDIRYTDQRGTLHIALAGWPVCCSGDRAVCIRKSGFMTYNPSDVTCKRCAAIVRVAEQHNE